MNSAAGKISRRLPGAGFCVTNWGKILEQHFQWRGTEKIVLYDDSQPYSFFFEEYTPYGRGICGAVILHGADNLQKAQYSVHT